MPELSLDVKQEENNRRFSLVKDEPIERSQRLQFPKVLVKSLGCEKVLANVG
jgi:hypothetical protein